MINTDENARILVMDQTGSLIAKKTGQAVVDYPKLSKQLTDRNAPDSGFQIIGTKTTGTLVSYVTSSHHEWLFLYTIPMSVVTGSSRLWGQTLLVLCVAITVLGIMGSYVLSGRIFTPIRRMLSLVRSEVDVTETVAAKETSQLEMNIHSILHRTRNMKELLQAYEGDTRKRFLQELLEGKQEADEDRLIETIRYYGHEVDDRGWYSVILVSMDQYVKFCSEHSVKDRNTLFLELAQIIEQEAAPDPTGFVLEMDSGEIAAVLHQEHSILSEEADRLAHAAARQLHVLISVDPDSTYTFTIGVSKAKQGLREISRAYYEAQKAVHDKIIFGYNSVNFYNPAQSKGEVVLYPYTIEKKILMAIKSGDESGTRHAFHEFGVYIQDMALHDLAIIKYYFLQLYSTSLKCIFEINPDLVSTLEYANNIELMEMDTLPDILNSLDQFYEKIFQYLSTKRSSKNRELSEMICTYIQDHLDQDLSQERLSSMIKVSSSHLRKLFKEETGQTLKDFIVDIRLKKAKELLEKPEIKVADIAGKIGYLSSQSFARAFRQVMGITPGEYRERHLQDQPQENTYYPD
ncbi:HTH-type transcriptional activator Btr [compost metagenome]